MTEPAEHDADTPTIDLVGKKWPIPELAARQLRKVRRPLVLLTRAFNGAKNGSDLIAAMIELSLTDDQFDQLYDVVYIGLTRAHPKLTPEEFDSWTISDGELISAFFVVRKQSHIFVVVPPTEGETDAGEAKAPETPGQGQTGTQ